MARLKGSTKATARLMLQSTAGSGMRWIRLQLHLELWIWSFGIEDWESKLGNDSKMFDYRIRERRWLAYQRCWLADVLISRSINRSRFLPIGKSIGKSIDWRLLRQAHYCDEPIIEHITGHISEHITVTNTFGIMNRFQSTHTLLLLFAAAMRLIQLS